jgi:hypothetical protein
MHPIQRSERKHLFDPNISGVKLAEEQTKRIKIDMYKPPPSPERVFKPLFTDDIPGAKPRILAKMGKKKLYLNGLENIRPSFPHHYEFKNLSPLKQDDFTNLKSRNRYN